MQTETDLTRLFRVVLAARYDKHEDYDAQVSPKAALLFHGVQYDPCLGRAGEWAFPSHMPITLQPGEPLPGQPVGVGRGGGGGRRRGGRREWSVSFAGRSSSNARCHPERA